MASLTAQNIVSRSDAFVAGALEGGVVLMSVEDDTYFDLNEVGARIWDKMQEPVAVSALCRDIVDAFEVDAADCESDVLAFLGDLLRLGAIRREDP